jgi:Zn-dependent protease with chaperone function
MSSYLFRLACLCLASFFLVHLVVGMLMWLITKPAIRIAEQAGARSGARLLLGLRLFPMGCAVVMVFALCVPSYLLLEPAAANEHLGLFCSLAALLGATVESAAIVRTRRAARSHRYAGVKAWLAGESSPAWIVNGTHCLVALAGIVRPRVIVSPDVVSALSRPELEASLRHERAHLNSRDNFKRLLILLAPEVLPYANGFQALNRAWSRLTEWAADDLAVDGDSTRALSLASALVRVSRMKACGGPSPLMSSLVPDGGDLPARIERLLGPRPARVEPSRWTPVKMAGAALAVICCVGALAMQPATLQYVHLLLEHLMD